MKKHCRLRALSLLTASITLLSMLNGLTTDTVGQEISNAQIRTPTSQFSSTERETEIARRINNVISASGDSVGCETQGTLDSDLMPPRNYLTGMIGASFANLDITDGELLDDKLFTAGVALGRRYDRCRGALRIEIEGRARENIHENLASGIVTADLAARGVWSSTVNLWREREISNSFSIYGGGGIGLGGFDNVYRVTGPLGNIRVDETNTNFAWQIGTGLTYKVNCRMSLDLGYRFFSIVGDTARGKFTQFGPGSSIQIVDFDYGSQLSTSELLLSFRFDEPFKNRRRRD